MEALLQPRARKKRAPRQKTASSDFFQHPNNPRPENRPPPWKTQQGNTTYTYKIASGRPYWSSRDPIEEEGGLNLYGFIRNDGLGNWDVLGLKCSECKCPYKESDFSKASVYEKQYKEKPEVTPLSFSIVIGAAISITKKAESVSCTRKITTSKCKKFLGFIGACKCKAKAVYTCKIVWKRWKTVIVSIDPQIGVGSIQIELPGNIKVGVKDRVISVKRGKRTRKEGKKYKCK